MAHTYISQRGVTGRADGALVYCQDKKRTLQTKPLYVHHATLLMRLYPHALRDVKRTSLASTAAASFISINNEFPF